MSQITLHIYVCRRLTIYVIDFCLIQMKIYYNGKKGIFKEKTGISKLKKVLREERNY